MLNSCHTYSVENAQESTSSYQSDTNSYFSFDKLPIGPLFPSSLISSFYLTVQKKFRKFIRINGDDGLRLIPDVNDLDYKDHKEELNLNAPRVKNLEKKYSKRLKLKLCPSGMTKMDLELIVSELKYMTNLKYLSIDFSGYLCTQEGLKVFCRVIGKYLKRLECLTVKCRKIENSCLKILKHFSSLYLHNLKDFRILTPNGVPEGIKNIRFEKSRYLKNLQGLELYLCGRDNYCSLPIKATTFDQRKSFQNSRRHLSLYFIPLKQEYCDKTLQFLSSSVLKFLPTLKSLALDLECLDMSENTAHIFIKALNNIVHNLMHLRIHLNTCEYFTEEFFNLFQCPENNQLTKLEIQLATRDIPTEQGFLPVEPLSIFIINSLQRLKNLTYLDLRFYLVDIKDQGVKAFTSCIAQFLTKLEFIHISFFWSSAITKETLTAFKEDFCTEDALLNLKSLIITFSGCDNLIEKDVDLLKTTLTESKPHIQNIHISSVNSHTDTDSDWEPHSEEDNSSSGDSDENCDYFLSYAERKFHNIWC